MRLVNLGITYSICMTRFACEHHWAGQELDMDRLPNISTSNTTLTGMSMGLGPSATQAIACFPVLFKKHVLSDS